jgi:hypothetical protein
MTSVATKRDPVLVRPRARSNLHGCELKPERIGADAYPVVTQLALHYRICQPPLRRTGIARLARLFALLRDWSRCPVRVTATGPQLRVRRRGCERVPHERPPASPTALWQCPAMRGFAVEASKISGPLRRVVSPVERAVEGGWATGPLHGRPATVHHRSVLEQSRDHGCTRRDAELGEDAPEVRGDRPGADVEHRGNRLVGIALGHHAGDL